MLKIRSLDGGFEYEAGVLLVLLIKLLHPAREGVGGHDQILPPVAVVHQHVLSMEAHHKVVEIMGHQF